jgi:hypothetical protein
MKTSKISSYKKAVSTTRHSAHGWLAAGLAVIIGLSSAAGICRAQPSDRDVPGAEVLTRGPVHEAFAGMVTYNPEPGVVINKAPPELIEEMPPEERPEGDNVAWIPGYWGWDDERNDFLWVSGTWRALPPGREWMAGYWGETSQGHQWISGYWADASVRETTYLPPPPKTVEVGPNIAAPSVDYGWSPGCWVWYQGRYAWQPGYWAQGRADWDWMPSHYVWTPRGYIFVGGYWDYPVQRRGIVFAPVYFESSYYARRGYVYSPSIVISLGVFTDHLFLRPSYSHYYFGDYYAPSYHRGGFYASFSFQSSRHGYDPFYSRHRWTHRQDRDWERRTETSYQYRRDHEAARPPRTYAAQSSISVSVSATERSQMLVAAPIEQVAKRTDGGMRFQAVAKAERQQISGRGQAVQKSREQRRTLETSTVATPTRTSGETFQPTKVEMPRSPIVAKPVKELGRNQAPPQVQKAPKPDLKRQPKSEPAERSQNVERGNSQSQPRQVEPEQKPTPRRNEATPRERDEQPKSPRRTEELQTPAPTPREVKPDLQSQPKPEPAGRSPSVERGNSQSQPRKVELEQRPTPQRNEAAPREREVKPTPRRTEESQPATATPREATPALKSQPKSEPANRPSNVERGNSQSQPRQLEPEQKPAPQRSETAAPRERQVQPKAPPKATEVEAPRNARGSEKVESGESKRTPQSRPGPSEKGAAQLRKPNSNQKDK